MAWLTGFFKEKFKGTQERSDESKKQDFTGMMQAVVEETIMATAYWLIGTVNSRLDNKANPQAQTTENDAVTSSTAEEALLPKVVNLVEQLSDRNQLITALEARLCVVETLLRENAVSERLGQASSEAIMAQEIRLSSMEALVKDFEVSQAVNHKLSHQSEALEARVASLEKMLSRYSVLPKMIDRHHRAITTLQHRLFIPKRPSENNHHEERAVLTANLT